MNTSERKAHWNNIYQTKDFHQVGWFQKSPDVSLSFVRELSISENAKIIDIGAGESYFVDCLFQLGFSDIHVLDISSKAIEKARQRLGDQAQEVSWITGDVLDLKKKNEFDIWHDRAVFHFLLEQEEIEQYIENATNGIKMGGYLIIGTFSEKGPDKCSGLPVKQYSIQNLESVFSPHFRLIKALNIDHFTPTGQAQNYSFCCFKKNAYPAG
jgi:2-polyprenyl-3-methyl-5-hydroxy-6-metoxy-1,4-benzoquinol methylase